MSTLTTTALDRETRMRDASGGPVTYEVPLTIQPEWQIRRLQQTSLAFMSREWQDMKIDAARWPVIHRVSCGILAVDTIVVGGPWPEHEGVQFQLSLEIFRARPGVLPIIGNRFEAPILVVRNDFNQFARLVNAGLLQLADRLSRLEIALDRPVLSCEPIQGGADGPITEILKGTGFALVR